MAQLLQPQDGYGPIKNIREWQSRQLNIQPSDYIDEIPEQNEIARLSANLLSLFKEVILALPEQTTIPKDARISLERSCSALILWSDGYGIAQGRLNDTFKKSSKLRHTLFKGLSHIGRVLTERLIPLADISSEKLQMLCSSVESNIEDASGIINEELCGQSDDSSSDAGSAFSDDNIYEIAEDLKTDTSVLSGLDPLIKYPIFDLEQEDAIRDYVHSTLGPEKFFSDKIENRFPRIDVSLASRLGKINFERYLRCQTDRDALEKEEGLPSTQEEGPELAGTIIANSKFHDSGMGTSIAPTMTYAETIMSYGNEGQSVRIPPLPKDAKAGLSFSCVVCGHTVVITNNSAWKRHIYLDLQPYTCLDMSCPYSSTTFESREKWISHLALDHEMEPRWDSIECLLCKEETGSGKLAVSRHFSRHLEEISLSALPVEVNSNVASENGSELSDSFYIKSSTSSDGSENPQHQNPLASPSLPYTGQSRSMDANSMINEGEGKYHDDKALRFLDIIGAYCTSQPGKYNRLSEIFIGLKGASIQEHSEAISLLNGNSILQELFNSFSMDELRVAHIARGLHGSNAPLFSRSQNYDVSKPPISSRFKSDVDQIVWSPSASPYLHVAQQLSPMQQQILQQPHHPKQQTAAKLSVTEASDIPSRPTNEDSQAEHRQEKQDTIGFDEFEPEWVTKEFLIKVKSRFIDTPHIYGQLIGIIRSIETVHDDQRNAQFIEQALVAVEQLFGSNLDLLTEFRKYLSGKIRQPYRSKSNQSGESSESNSHAFLSARQYIEGHLRAQQDAFNAEESSKNKKQITEPHQSEDHLKRDSFDAALLDLFAPPKAIPPYESTGFRSPQAVKTTSILTPWTRSHPKRDPSISADMMASFTSHKATPSFESIRSHPPRADKTTSILTPQMQPRNHVSPYDLTDQRRYCYCNDTSYGTMIACDADDCRQEWFHLKCVGLDAPPTSLKWFCKDCEKRRNGDVKLSSDNLD